MTDRHRQTVRELGGHAASTSAGTIRLGVARARGFAATVVGVQVAGRRSAAAPAPSARTERRDRGKPAGAPEPGAAQGTPAASRSS